MLQKSFSEGIFLENEGPKSSKNFKSSCDVIAERSYITAVSFAPKLIAKRTYFTVDAALPENPSVVYNRACSLSNGGKLYESSISIDPSSLTDGDIPYYQNIELEPRMVMKDFSETIFSFPKMDTRSYVSSVMYDPCHTKETYIVGLEVHKVREVILGESEDQLSSFTSSMHIDVPDEEGLVKGAMNGVCKSPELVNGI